MGSGGAGSAPSRPRAFANTAAARNGSAQAAVQPKPRSIARSPLAPGGGAGARSRRPAAAAAGSAASRAAGAAPLFPAPAGRSRGLSAAPLSIGARRRARRRHSAPHGRGFELLRAHRFARGGVASRRPAPAPRAARSRSALPLRRWRAETPGGRADRTRSGRRGWRPSARSRSRPCAAALRARCRKRPNRGSPAARPAHAGDVAEHDRRVDPGRRARRARWPIGRGFQTVRGEVGAPASPPLPPLVETSTIVRCVSRAANTRASSISAAVPDSSASEEDPTAPCGRGGRGSRSARTPTRARAPRDHGAQRPFPFARLRLEFVRGHLKAPMAGRAEPFQRLCDLLRERPIAGTTRAPARELGREALQFGERGRAFERVRGRRRAQRPRRAVSENAATASASANGAKATLYRRP